MCIREVCVTTRRNGARKYTSQTLKLLLAGGGIYGVTRRPCVLFGVNERKSYVWDG
jgi:hypothetical protein